MRAALHGTPVVLAGLLVWNIGNYAFFVIAGRSLGPQAYASVAALLSATMLVQIPAGAVQIGISRQIADLDDPDGPDGTWLMRHAMASCIGAGAIAAVATGIVIRFVAPSLPIAAVLWTALAVLPIPAFALATGILQGRQRFVPFSVSVSMLGIPRPLVLLLLLGAASGLVAAMAASAIAVALAAVTAVVLAAPRLHEVPNPPPLERWRAFRRTIAPLAAGLAGFGVLVNLDIIVGRAAFSEQTAGLFGAVGVLAKATVIVPQAVAWVLLPKVTAAVARRTSTAALLRIGVVVTLAVGGLLTLAGALFAEPLVVLVFGEAYREGAGYFAPLIGTTTITGLLLLLMNHQLARGIDSFAWWIAGLGCLEAVLFLFLHGSVGQLIVIELVVGVLGVLLYESAFGRSDAGLSRSILAMRKRRSADGRSRER